MSAGAAHASRPIQKLLFGGAIDVASLKEQQARVMSAKRATNTERTYAHSWEQFSSWCVKAGRPPLPASEETVGLYVTWCLDAYRLKTIRLRLAAIANMHGRAAQSSPVTSDIRELVRNAARLKTEEPAGKAALTPEQLRRMCEHLGTSARDVRDRAILLVGFASGWRRSEIAALRLADIRFEEGKGVVLRLRRSKTDQHGRGRITGIHRGRRASTCPVRALHAWLAVRGEHRGPLFTRIPKSGDISREGLSGESIHDMVQRVLSSVGVNPVSYGAHSLRAGMITAASEGGAGEAAIMARSGHRSLATVISYIRPANVFRTDPLAGVL